MYLVAMPLMVYHRGTVKERESRVKKVLLFIGLGIVLVVGATVTTLFVSGRAALVMKEPEEQVVLYRNVCSGELRNKYIEQFQNRGLLKKDEISEFVAPIKEMKSWDKDVNCVYIVMQEAIANQDKVESKRLADMQKTMNDNGQNISKELSRVGVAAEFAEEAAEFDPGESMGGI